jgi:hypothetical protein
MRLRLQKGAGPSGQNMNIRKVLLLAATPICAGMLGCAWCPPSPTAKQYRVEDYADDTQIELFTAYWSELRVPDNPMGWYEPCRCLKMRCPDGTQWDIGILGDDPAHWLIYVRTPSGLVKRVDLEYIGFQRGVPEPPRPSVSLESDTK